MLVSPDGVALFVTKQAQVLLFRLKRQKSNCKILSCIILLRIRVWTAVRLRPPPLKLKLNGNSRKF